MDYSVIDIESDGLIDQITKIHCLTVQQYRGEKIRKFTLVSYEDMVAFLLSEPILVGHKIITYDIPALEKILKIKITARLVDTLGLSWYLYPKRLVHGLEAWGEDLGVPKPKISDWSNLTLEEYIFRCESDVEINVRLFNLQIQYLIHIYDNDMEKVNRLVNYISFKLDCAREQEEVRWRIDVEKCEKNLKFLQEEYDKRFMTLKPIIPKIIEYKDVSRPKAVYKKIKPTKKNPNPAPEYTVAGQNWMDLLSEKGLPEYHLGTIRIPIKEKEGNPGSHTQLKAWLFSIGWIPSTFRYVKEKDGSQRKVPQISKENEPELCDSVKALYNKVPQLRNLNGMFIIRHRITILKGFLENRDENNFVKAEIKGLTNTLRFQHTIVVNLPTIPKPYWKEVRECLIAPDDNHVLCGSDMSGLEDNTKRHYMFYYDPEYVREMMAYAFDAHCDISTLSHKMSKDEEAFYKWSSVKKEGGDYERVLREFLEKRDANTSHQNSATGYTLEELLAMPSEEQGKHLKTLKPIRSKSKKVNFAGVYGAGPPKIAATGGFPLAEAKILHTTYWKRNWAVKKVAQACTVKVVGGQMWLLNPVSQFWYSLRADKDRFSTLNQGTGVYCFDSWVRNVRKQGVKNCGQFHDEIISPVLATATEEHRVKLKNAIELTNSELRLNVVLGISIDFGKSYAEIH